MKEDGNASVKFQIISIYEQYLHSIIEYQIQYDLEIYTFFYRLVFELSYESTTL